MSEIPSNACIGCKRPWNEVTQATRTRKSKDGLAGELFPRCEGCQTKRNRTGVDKKRKHDDFDDLESSDLPKIKKQAGLAKALHELIKNPWTEYAAMLFDFKTEHETYKTCALRIAALVRDYTGYQFTFRDQERNTQRSKTTVRLACLQRDTAHQEPKKQCPDPAKARDARRNPRFPCNGRLNIVFQDGSEALRLSLTHDVVHEGYCNVAIPSEWKQYIETHKAMTPPKIWTNILDEWGDGEPSFNERSVYYYWMQLMCHEWKHAEDPIASARQYVEANQSKRHLQLLDLKEEPGTEVIAFVITDFMEFGHWTQSFLTDSTFGVNKQGLELFAGVADIHGEGLPLSFLFIDKKGKGTEGAKQRVLVSWFTELKKLGIDPEFTLSDKDDSEINAMRLVWPLAKHQLCLWHALQALKRRLAKLLEGLAYYDAEEANTLFGFIDKLFLPYSRLGKDEIPEQPPLKPLFPIKLTVGGLPPVITPSLVMRLPGAQKATDRESIETNPEETQGLQDNIDDARSDDGAFFGNQLQAQQSTETGLLGNEEFGEEEEDAMQELQEMFKRAKKDMRARVRVCEDWEDDESASEEDGDESDYIDDEDVEDEEEMAENIRVQAASSGRGGKGQVPKAKAPSIDSTQDTQKGKKSTTRYQFCPHEHRLAIMRLFARHFNQHSLLPERHGQRRTSTQIYRGAVFEMYMHCKRNHLRDVWAYLWVNWYCPKMWPLWARSHYPLAISRKRTTMTVESVWRNFKRLAIPHHARVSADMSIHLLCKETIARSRNRLLKHTSHDPRKGRKKKLSAEQAAMKKKWLQLNTATIKGTYRTDPNMWTCNCGSQKYNAFLLCKHLVQSIPVPSPDWWPEAVRYSVPPFYVVPGVPQPMEPEKLTEYGWLSRRATTADPAPEEDELTEQEMTSQSPQKRAATTQVNHRLMDNLPEFTDESTKSAEIANMLSILDKFRESIVSQGPNIDERLLRTMKSRMGGIIEFQNAIDTLRNARVPQGTFSRHSQLTWGFRLE